MNFTAQNLRKTSLMDWRSRYAELDNLEPLEIGAIVWVYQRGRWLRQVVLSTNVFGYGLTDYPFTSANDLMRLSEQHSVAFSEEELVSEMKSRAAFLEETRLARIGELNRQIDREIAAATTR